MNRFVARGVLWVAVSLGAHGAALTAAAEECLQPHGIDDTNELQSALEGCSGSDGPCAVSLCAGRFRIAPVRVADFRGELRGAGREQTIIEALPELEVVDNAHDYFRDDPFGATPWPFLIQFFGGEAELHDFSVEVPAPEEGRRPTLGWFGGAIFELDGAILITTGLDGVVPVDFDVRRIRILAGQDTLSPLDTTLLSGVFFQGRVLNPHDPGSYPVFPVRGRYSVSESEFVGMLSGTPVAETDGATVTIVNNTYRSGFALHVQDGSRSRFWMANNTWDTLFGGVQVLMNVDGEISEDNRIIAFGNSGATLVPQGDWGTAFQYLDPWDPARAPGGTTLLLARNQLTVDTTRGPALSGIDVVGAGDLTVWSNVLRGKASLGGIHVDSTSGCRVLFNSLRTVAGPDLVLGAGTSGCLAVVSRRDHVLDQGVNNRIYRR